MDKKNSSKLYWGDLQQQIQTRQRQQISHLRKPLQQSPRILKRAITTALHRKPLVRAPAAASGQAAHRSSRNMRIVTAVQAIKRPSSRTGCSSMSSPHTTSFSIVMARLRFISCSCRWVRPRRPPRPSPGTSTFSRHCSRHQPHRPWPLQRHQSTITSP